MDISNRIDGQLVSASGSNIAYIRDSKIRVSRTTAPESYYKDCSFKSLPKEIISIIWSHDSELVALLSHNRIEISSTVDAGHRIRIDNGGAGLGRFASAEFLGPNHLLTMWEFGRAKIWDLSGGRSMELGDLKTMCTGQPWSRRPSHGNSSSGMIACISRSAAEDELSIHFFEQGQTMPKITLPTIDAQSLSWSPDGRWLAVRDTSTTAVSAHFLTPDGHRYRSFPASPSAEASGLGVKATTWSSNSQKIALSGYDGSVTLLNTRMFTPIATIEHNISINQAQLDSSTQAPIWQEHVSATAERTYTLATQPVSLPLSRSKPAIEPNELGVAEMCFNADGSFLATRDERMLSTVWIWSMQTLSAYAVLLQHANVRKMHWHPTRPEQLLLHCGEGVAYIFDAGASSEPVAVAVPLPGNVKLSWLDTAAEEPSAILAVSSSAFCVLYPEGRPTDGEGVQSSHPGAEAFEEGDSEDSVMDVLSGRKRVPRSERSYTEQIHLDVEEEISQGLDDTFSGKKRPGVQALTVDPLDDSEIF